MSDAARSTRNRENTRARLFEAAGEVFAEIGVDAASVEMITERAGFTRGAFYSNFESKDELFFQLTGWVTDHKLEQVSARVRELEAMGVREMPVEEILARVLDVAVDEPVGVRLMNEFRTKAMRDERTAAAYLAWQGGMQQRIESIVEDLARAADIRLTMQAAELAQMVMFIWEGTSVQAVIEGEDFASTQCRVSERTIAIVAALVQSQVVRAPAS